MNVGGWIVMILAISIVLSLCIFCFYKILTEKKPKHKAPLDIDIKNKEKS